MDEDLRIVFEGGGTRDSETDIVGDRVVVIGTGAEGGIYERTEEVRGNRTVFRWRELSDAEAEAIVRGDLRANQHQA